MYEHRSQPPISHRAFVLRLVRSALAGAGLVTGSLLLGMLGYHQFESLSWVDAFLNASMLLGGMGPVGAFTTASAKLFATFFALYAGLVFLAVAGVLLAPVVHRLLHTFHLEKDRGRRS